MDKIYFHSAKNICFFSTIGIFRKTETLSKAFIVRPEVKIVYKSAWELYFTVTELHLPNNIILKK